MATESAAEILKTNDDTTLTKSAVEPAVETEKKEKILILKTNDNETFELEESIAIQCGLIKIMVEDDCASHVIPVTNVSSKNLIKIIEYLKAHAHADKDDVNNEELKKFDKNYLDGLKDDEVFELLNAANYLNVKGVFDVACKQIADSIKDMKVEEVRGYFGIGNDFTPEEEEKVRNEHLWAYE